MLVPVQKDEATYVGGGGRRRKGRRRRDARQEVEINYMNKKKKKTEGVAVGSKIGETWYLHMVSG